MHTLTVPEAVAEYLAHGWKLCRISPGAKGPKGAGATGWNEPGRDVQTPAAFPLGWGVGLLHAYSGTMALDIDNYPVALAWLAERGVDLDALMAADDAVQITSGRPDSAKLLYACPARPGKACAPYPGKNKAGEPITKLALDFRCATGSGNTQQDVLPPSIHPDRGQPYEWRMGMCADWHTLPPLPAELEAVWDALRAPAPESAATVAIPVGAAPAKIEAWLATQDPGMCRTDWVVVGMKLHAEFQGSMEGFSVWQRWSSKSAKWDDEARHTMLGIWKGYRLEGRQLATLEADLRAMPAEATEFNEITEVESKSSEFMNIEQPAVVPGELIEAEPAYAREIREIMQAHVVLQTGGAEPYFLLPGHPMKEVRTAAGLAGVEIGSQQLANIFGPYLPPIPAGKAMIPADPCAIIRHAKWRRSVHRMAFNPGGPEAYSDGDGHTYLNAYKAIPVEPIKPRPHEIEPLRWLLRRVLDDKNEPNGGVFSQWLMRLFAFALKNPGVKVKWAPLLYSAEQGTGKTTLMETLPALLYGRQYVKPMVHTVLRERFAGAKFDSTWWVCLSEMHSDAGKVDARTIANKLKPWITDSTIQIEKKGIDSYEIKNHLQFTAVSNHDDALYIEEGTTDRRWLVGEMLGKALTPSDMSMLNPLFGDDFKRDPKAVNWLHWFFLNEVDLSGFNPSEPPPDTAAKRRVREQSRSTWEDAIYTAYEQMTAPFDKDIVTPADLTEGLLIGKGVSLAQAKTLIKRMGGQEMSRTDSERNMYCVRYHDKWIGAKSADVKAHRKSGFRHFELVDDASDLL